MALKKEKKKQQTNKNQTLLLKWLAVLQENIYLGTYHKKALKFTFLSQDL